MSLFNKKPAGTKTVNRQGAPAYSMGTEMELYSAAVTSLLGGDYYESADGRLERLRKLVAAADPQFTARLAVYARQKMNLRSMPLVLVTELARKHNGDDLVSRAVDGVVQRADEITELLSYYAVANERKDRKKLGKLSKQLRVGLRKAFNRFSEYAFAKYDREGAITLKDALFVVNPKAKDERQAEIFKGIIDGTLSTPDTWEVGLSAGGKKTPEEKKAVWEGLIERDALGYMAAMRNLRNLLEAGVSTESLTKVLKKIADPAEVVKSKQFPFRFLSAYREIKEIQDGRAGLVMQALEDAILASVANVAGFGPETAVTVACDVSGSMQNPVSPKSKVMNFDIGLCLGMLLRSRCKDVEVGMFGDTWKVIGTTPGGILANVEEFYRREGEVGYSTNGHAVVDDLVRRRAVKDKVVMFTDCQMWDSDYTGGATLQNSWNKYKKIAPDARLYLFDLSGQGTTTVGLGGDVSLIAGWSNSIFEMLEAIENGSKAVEEIRKLEI